MRECHNCGYLVPETWTTCKRCHAALLDRVPALAGRAAPRPAAPLAAAPIAPSTPPPAPTAPAPVPAGGPPPLPTLPRRTAPPLPTASPSGGAYDASYNAPTKLGGPIGPGGYVPPASFGAEDDGGAWAAPVAPKSTARSPWLKVLALAVVLVVGFAGVRFVQERLNAPPAAVQAFIDGEGVTYTAPNGSYSVRLPQQPTVTSQSDPTNGTTFELAVIEEDKWEAVLAVAVLPSAIPATDAQQLMELAAAGGNSAISGEIERQEMTTHEGHPALDVEFEPPDGYPMHARVVVVGNRVYMVAAHAVNGTSAFFEALVESLHVATA